MSAGRITVKTRTWADNFNNVIRYELFRDSELKALMIIPDNTTIIQFVEKYLIEDVSPDEIITDEKVRIAYYDTEGRDTGNRHVRNKYKEFDIFVKEDVLRNATNDRLQNRCHLIADRLRYLLMREYHICQLHFEYEDEYNLWTKVVGYKRYHITFSYKISV